MKRILLSFIVLFVVVAHVQAQDKYWISFTDKDLSSYSYQTYLSPLTISNRTRFDLPLYQYTDVPVNTSYVKELQGIGVQTICRSRWLNSVSAFLTPEQVKEVEQLSFVSGVYKIDRNIVMMSTGINVDPEYMHKAMKQMGLSHFISAGLNGQDVMVGVIDAGFYDATTDKFLLHLFDENKIITQRDFIDPSRKDIIREQATDADEHGRMVLDMIGGYDPVEKVQYGMAPNARYVLARTENGASESRREEDHWIMAMEWMDSMGVRLISTSLGYAIKMDNPDENYTQAEMNGKTARISKAAQIASDEKGLFLVVSAGNEGDNKDWMIVGAPADAQGVLSVGATKPDVLLKIGYSSLGPDFLPYLKPNVSCFSPNGTSFSAPAVAGFVACLMQRAPDISSKELKSIVEKSGHLYPYGNNYLGYGVPQAQTALKLIEDRSYNRGRAVEKVVKGSVYKQKLDKNTNLQIEIFHKKNETIVVEQVIGEIKKGKLMIKRPAGVARTTFTVGSELVVEIIWENK